LHIRCGIRSVAMRMKISINGRHVIALSDSSVRCCLACHTNIMNGEVKERKPSELEDSFSELSHYEQDQIIGILPDQGRRWNTEVKKIHVRCRCALKRKRELER
jgi:hypothetical protein